MYYRLQADIDVTQNKTIVHYTDVSCMAFTKTVDYDINVLYILRLHRLYDTGVSYIFRL